MKLVAAFSALCLFGLSHQAPFQNDNPWYQGECGDSKYADAGRNPGTRSKRSIEQFIVNGWDARQGEFPWQASLRRGSSHMCGAVIINRNWLLTAAHCTEGQSPSRLTVVVGGHDRRRHPPTSNDGVSYQIERIIQHADYDLDGEIENDIALMETLTGMVFNEDIQPACKPTGDNYGSLEGTTSGWGRIGDWMPLGNILQVANNPLMEHGDCHACFPNPTDIYPGMLCFGYCGSNTQSTCNGDSGGPMVVKRDAKFDIVGLTSWGMGGCLSRYPPVFTNVSFFSDWVDEKLESALVEQIQLY